ncbi:MAG: tungstate transport system ATP-binding protein [Candidatus Binatota bacterium]|nr:tungstate transport system ATP-binding protein [Candidatus Binatota bacterium]
MKAELAAEWITKRYGDRTVLTGVSLTIARGEIHAVLGPSGSGKTTLLRIMNLLEAPDEGTVRLDGEEIQVARAAEPLDGMRYAARLRMAMVFQKPVAFRRTVVENAALGLEIRGRPRAEIVERVSAVLQELGLARLANAPARRLSAGEQQRLAFARAAVLGVDFLLLDEFTANLDPRNVDVLERAARAYAREHGGGVLLVTHDLFQARRVADRVSLLSEGRLVESAPKTEFFESPKDPRTRGFLAGELAL